MSSDVTAPIEGAVQGVRGVRRVSSESREGGASLTAELERLHNAGVRGVRRPVAAPLRRLRGAPWSCTG